jgi:bifunctional DNA-binding transcriptional regulator/antitoxin component of YhaV-PrlF toxin-antitoxin module
MNSMRTTTPTKTPTKKTAMPTVRVGAHREVQLPDVVTKRLRIRQGAKLEVLVSGDGIFLIPSKRIPKEQRYFYTEEWQAKEREADESIARGEVTGPFSDATAAIRALRTAKV